MHANIAEERKIVDVIVGSQAYGTNLSNSDEDTVAVCIPTIDYFFGYKKFDQVVYKAVPGVQDDRTIYDLRKIVGLILDNNPNCMDILFTADRCIKYMSPYWERVRDLKDEFVSKKTRHTFSGYGFAQLERIKLHRAFLLHPPKKEPDRKDYGLPDTPTFPASQLDGIIHLADDFFEPETKQDMIEDLKAIYSDQVLILIKKNLREEYREIAIDLFRKGLESQLYAIKSIGNEYIKPEYKEMAINELAYAAAMKGWKRYLSWKAGRNKSRAELEEKFGFDCYSDDTEFLTNNGWMSFDDIKQGDMLATVCLTDCTNRKLFSIEYQNYIDKYEGIYTGNMYHLNGNHLDVLVTPNHRMLINKKERKSRKYSGWQLEQASSLPDCFDVLRTITPKIKTFGSIKKNIIFKDLNIPINSLISLMGWFLSDGSFSFYKNKVKSLTIAQKKGGRLHNNMSKFNNRFTKTMSTSLCIYDDNDVVLSVRNKALIEFIHNNCGHAKNKRIPRWIFSMSKLVMERLFDAMMLGDGTIRKTSYRSCIYYSSVKNLADDVCELAILCGWETSIYGPYYHYHGKKKCVMYQVHVNKNVSQTKQLVRNQNISKQYVDKKRIVCFSVPNKTLITRRNGHVAYHGNSKHASHLVRLMRMGTEILETGKVNVDRTHIDADELKAIRLGEWSFDKVEQYAHDMDSKMEGLYKTSALRKTPNHELVSEKLIQIIQDYLTDKKEL